MLELRGRLGEWGDGYILKLFSCFKQTKMNIGDGQGGGREAGRQVRLGGEDCRCKVSTYVVCINSIISRISTVMYLAP